MGISTSRAGRTRSLSTACSSDLGAGVVAGEQRARPEHLGGEPAEHLGEPVERVGMARAVLGVAVQRQVGEHDAEAVGEPLDGGLPLLVGEHRGVQQRERRSGAELAVGDAGAVVVVVEAQPHGPIVGALVGAARVADERPSSACRVRYRLKPAARASSWNMRTVSSEYCSRLLPRPSSFLSRS